MSWANKLFHCWSSNVNIYSVFLFVTQLFWSVWNNKENVIFVLGCSQVWRQSKSGPKATFSFLSFVQSQTFSVNHNSSWLWLLLNTGFLWDKSLKESFLFCLKNNLFVVLDLLSQTEKNAGAIFFFSLSYRKITQEVSSFIHVEHLIKLVHFILLFTLESGNFILQPNLCFLSELGFIAAYVVITFFSFCMSFYSQLMYVYSNSFP